MLLSEMLCMHCSQISDKGKAFSSATFKSSHALEMRFSHGVH